MNTDQMEWLDEHCVLAMADFMKVSGLSEVEMRELVDRGLLNPLSGTSAVSASAWIFTADRVVVARAVTRLRDDFELDLSGLALAFSLMDRIVDLERNLRDAQVRMTRR